MSTPNETKISELETQIFAGIRKHTRLGRMDSFLSQLFFWIAVLASGFASVSVGTKFIDDTVTAFIAAIPALVLVIDSTFKYEARSDWHWTFQRKLIVIARDLKFTELSPPPARIAEALSKLEEEMYESFPGMGRGFTLVKPTGK